MDTVSFVNQADRHTVDGCESDREPSCESTDEPSPIRPSVYMSKIAEYCRVFERWGSQL